jgi:hypothetical protein
MSSEANPSTSNPLVGAINQGAIVGNDEIDHRHDTI